MKTTVDIPDSLFQEAKNAAAEDDTTLRALVDEGLRLVLKKRRESRPFVLRDVSFRGNGLRPEIEDGDWETIRRLAYEGRGG